MLVAPTSTVAARVEPGARFHKAGPSGSFLFLSEGSGPRLRPRSDPSASPGKNGELAGIRVILYSHFPVKCDHM